MSFGPKCPAGDSCENRIFLEEYEKVDREYERKLVRDCAELRMQVNILSAQVDALRDPEEERDDGKRVRKDRWEMGIRRIASLLGMANKPFEVDDIVRAVNSMHAERVSAKATDPR
jgi:hypothetical protein